MSSTAATRSLHPALAAALAVLISAAAALLRTGLLEAPPEFDELYHLLAARGWLKTGTPAILDGQYGRGLLFTRAVAQLFASTGTDSLETGRLISLAAGSLLPAVLFLWLAYSAGLAIGLTAAALTIFWPQSQIEAQLLRFYALHVLCFFIGAAAFYNVLTGHGFQRFAWAAAAAAAWGLAVKLQISSVIGISAALVWGCTVSIFALIANWRGRITAIAAAAALLALALAAAAFADLLEKAWAFYRWTPDHNAALRDYPGFYHANLRKYHGILWYGTPLLAALALWLRPKPASYCLTLFAAFFLTLSFGGMKAFRYLSCAVPLLFALWAIAMAGGTALTGKILSKRRPDRRPVLTGLTAVFLLAAVLTASGFVQRSLQVARGEGIAPRGDWRQAGEAVGNWLDAPFTATTRELHMLAYVGPYDLLINSSRITELPSPQEFGIDPRTGRPIAGSPAAIARLLACKREGLLVAGAKWWSAGSEAVAMQSQFEAAGLQIETRRKGPVLAVRWSDPSRRRSNCTGLPL
ncbi:hypothetical protein ETW23_21975 (plasmid) [Leisingera sp. NJS201]|uniref:hypothetical protein n=1 Tax=Leisingera sp. NJS201 TaxID=2508306 RepID=UPI00107158FC|nr:hypothetical protein [Leisingera sp. NJS201]QBR38574.1 hypothetical protein ETW23_21975 [Leisingera sp. NJS201]